MWMRDEYNSVFPTPTEADNIGKTQILTNYIGPNNGYVVLTVTLWFIIR